MDIKKISELEEAQTLYDGCCFPIVQNEETKRVKFQTMSEMIREGLTDEIIAAEQYVDEKVQEVKQIVVKQPIIQNGTWWVWNDFDRRYVDTGQAAHGAPGEPGADGEDGFSPTVSTSKAGKVTTVVITDAEGDHTFEIRDGEDGQGTGDMTKAAYDSNNAVANAGGINAFIEGKGYLTQHQDISGKENTSNKVTSISSASTNNQYPTAKCVYDIVGNIEALLAEV